MSFNLPFIPLQGEFITISDKGPSHSGSKGPPRVDPTFVWLDKAYEEYDSWMFQLRDTVWDPLRTDPRFQEPLRRMKLRE